MNWFKQLLTRPRTYSDLSEEIQQHLAEKTEALMALGMSRSEEAEQSARREFGNVTGIEERSREGWIWPIADSLWLDTKFAMRQLRKNYGFALTATLTLGLAIGSTTAIFSLVNTVLLEPLRFPEQDRLVWLNRRTILCRVWCRNPSAIRTFSTGAPAVTRFSGMAAYNKIH